MSQEFLCSHAPPESWGTEGKVTAWLAKGREAADLTERDQFWNGKGAK